MVKVSVIVITYNQEHTIRQTIESLIVQKCDFSYKIIVNDDCSKDGTPAILKKYAEEYTQLIDLQLNEKNLGIVGNYFNAVNRSSSDYIACCAGDDWWCDPAKLQKQVAFMEAHPDCGYLYAGYKRFINGHYLETPLNRCYSFDEIVTKGSGISALTSFYRRSLGEKYQNEVQPLIHDWGMEDLPMILWFSLESKIMSIDDVMGVYRIEEGSAYHGCIDKAIAMSIRSYNICSYYINKYHREYLLPAVQKKHVTSMIYKYLGHALPVDRKLCDTIYHITPRDGKMYLLYMISRVSILRKWYAKRIV